MQVTITFIHFFCSVEYNHNKAKQTRIEWYSMSLLQDT